MADKASSSSFRELLVLFLCFSYLLSSLAVPATRNLNPREQETPEQHLPLDQEEGDMFAARRIDMEENTDYPGTGANNHHDPKPPGKA